MCEFMYEHTAILTGDGPKTQNSSPPGKYPTIPDNYQLYHEVGSHHISIEKQCLQPFISSGQGYGEKNGAIILTSVLLHVEIAGYN